MKKLIKTLLPSVILLTGCINLNNNSSNSQNSSSSLKNTSSEEVIETIITIDELDAIAKHIEEENSKETFKNPSKITSKKVMETVMFYNDDKEPSENYIYTTTLAIDLDLGYAYMIKDDEGELSSAYAYVKDNSFIYAEDYNDNKIYKTREYESKEMALNYFQNDFTYITNFQDLLKPDVQGLDSLEKLTSFIRAYKALEEKGEVSTFETYELNIESSKTNENSFKSHIDVYAINENKLNTVLFDETYDYEFENGIQTYCLTNSYMKITRKTKDEEIISESKTEIINTFEVEVIYPDLSSYAYVDSLF